MNKRKKAWTIISEHCEHGYEGDELEECRDYIDKFEDARAIVSLSMNRKWWEFWK